MTKQLLVSRFSFLLIFILLWTNSSAQDPISQNLFVLKRIKNSKGSYESMHLKGAAVSQFNFEKYLESHIEDFEIRITGNRITELETQNFEFISGNIKVEDCKRFCEKKESEASAFLGVSLKANEEMEGAEIIRTTSGSAAEKAGLQAGDIITQIDELIVHSPCDLDAMISEYYPGDRIKINYLRDETELEKELQLGARISSMITWSLCCDPTPPTIVQNISEAKQLVYIAPNPNTGIFQLSFELEADEPVIIRMTDNAGREVYKETIGDFNGFYNQNLDISKAGAGIYYLNIIQKNKVINKKIVLQKD